MIVFTILQSAIIVFSVIYTGRRMKKCEPISWKVKKGMRCYSCAAPLCSDAEETAARLFSETEEFRLCKACEREEKLGVALGSKKTKYINRFKKFCHSDKSYKINIYFAMGLFACIILSVLGKAFWKTDFYGILSFFANAIYWGLFVYRSKICFEEESK